MDKVARRRRGEGRSSEHDDTSAAALGDSAPLFPARSLIDVDGANALDGVTADFNRRQGLSIIDA